MAPGQGGSQLRLYKSRQTRAQFARLRGLLRGTGHALLPFFLQGFDLLWRERWWRLQWTFPLRVVILLLLLGLIGLRVIWLTARYTSPVPPRPNTPLIS